MSSAECWTDDGRHFWRWTVSRWTGEPRYECDYCSAAVIVWGDEDDAYYLEHVLGGTIVDTAVPS